MTATEIELSIACFFSIGVLIALVALYFLNVERKAENEGLLKLYDALKEELGEWEDCDPELEALRKSFASSQETTVAALDSVIAGLDVHHKSLDGFLYAENGRLLDFSFRLDAIELWIQSKAPQPPESPSPAPKRDPGCRCQNSDKPAHPRQPGAPPPPPSATPGHAPHPSASPACRCPR